MSENPAVLASYSSYKILAIRLLYLNSEFGIHPLRHQDGIASSIFKKIFLEIPIM